MWSESRYTTIEPAGPECQRADPSGTPDFVEQQAGSEEAGDHEEDVDPDEPTAKAAEVGVAAHHEQHRHSPQTVDVIAPPRHVAHLVETRQCSPEDQSLGAIKWPLRQPCRRSTRAYPSAGERSR